MLHTPTPIPDIEQNKQIEREKIQGNASTHHGTVSEPLAVNCLQEMGYEVKKKGTVVCSEHPWLSASPDGIIRNRNENTVHEVVEIKCPDINKTSFEEYCEKKTSDVKIVDSAYELSRNGPRGYYTQIQLTMFCTGIHASKLFIWTPEKHVLISVPYDADFVVQQVARLRQFYFKHMLPRLTDDFAEG
ncbi:uncharacterized protein LOC143277997 [Babylonia areolata]|uniref:uncharacterized protein LOC143277997 n=1 Tax=Babylonia areolata TaxID=304850 RepID=UPI003FD45618